MHRLDNIISSRKRSVAYYRSIQKRYAGYAKLYAKIAREQTNQLNKITKELDNQRKAYIAWEKELDDFANDTSSQLIWLATSRDASGRIQGEAYGNGLLTTQYYNSDG